MKNKIWIVGVIGILAIIAAAYYIMEKPENSEISAGGEMENSMVNVTLLINFSNGDIWNYNLSMSQENATVFNALLMAAKEGGWSVDYRYYGEYDSYFINSIAGEGGNGKYWIYYVNGKMGEVGADKKMLHGGDVVEWKLEEFS